MIDSVLAISGGASASWRERDTRDGARAGELEGGLGARCAARVSRTRWTWISSSSSTAGKRFMFLGEGVSRLACVGVHRGQAQATRSLLCVPPVVECDDVRVEFRQATADQ